MAFQGPAAKGPEMPMAPMLRDQQPMSAFGEVAAKDLFSQARSDPTLGAAKVQDSLEGRQLLGTLVIGDDQGGHHRGQNLGRQAETEVEVVYQGEEWGGFKVVEISNDSVTFSGRDGRRTLNFPE